MSRQFDRVAKARAQLVMDHPFFGSLALHLALEGSAKCKTFETDGKRLAFNASFAAGLTDPELRGVVAHEVLHCCYQHFARRGKRDGALWNEACDYAINLDLIDCGFVLPQGALINQGFRGQSAESIYAALDRETKKGGRKPAPNSFGEVSDGQADESERQDLATQWQAQALASAMVAAKQAGALPAGMARMVESLRSPKVDWREVMRRFVTDSCTRDYSWSRPNRRHIGAGLYLPSLQSTGRNHVIIAIDVSGSIDGAALAAFMGEAQGALDDGIADKVTVLACNTEITYSGEFQAGDTLPREFTGSGGTRFEPVMQWAMDHGADAACLVYFTDLYGSFGNDPGLPVLWADFNGACKAAPPYGEVIHIDGHG